MIDRFVADLRYALRILRRNPGFAYALTGSGESTIIRGLEQADNGARGLGEP